MALKVSGINNHMINISKASQSKMINKNPKKTSTICISKLEDIEDSGEIVSPIETNKSVNPHLLSNHQESEDCVKLTLEITPGNNINLTLFKNQNIEIVTKELCQKYNLSTNIQSALVKNISKRIQIETELKNPISISKSTFYLSPSPKQNKIANIDSISIIKDGVLKNSENYCKTQVINFNENNISSKNSSPVSQNILNSLKPSTTVFDRLYLDYEYRKNVNEIMNKDNKNNQSKKIPANNSPKFKCYNQKDIHDCPMQTKNTLEEFSFCDNLKQGNTSRNYCAQKSENNLAKSSKKLNPISKSGGNKQNRNSASSFNISKNKLMLDEFNLNYPLINKSLICQNHSKKHHTIENEKEEDHFLEIENDSELINDNTEVPRKDISQEKNEIIKLSSLLDSSAIKKEIIDNNQLNSIEINNYNKERRDFKKNGSNQTAQKNLKNSTRNKPKRTCSTSWNNTKIVDKYTISNNNPQIDLVYQEEKEKFKAFCKIYTLLNYKNLNKISYNTINQNSNLNRFA